MRKKREWYSFQFESASESSKFAKQLDSAIKVYRRSRAERASSLNARGLLLRTESDLNIGRSQSVPSAASLSAALSPQTAAKLDSPLSATQLPQPPRDDDEAIIFDLSPDKLWLQNDDDWACARCTYRNKGSDKVCTMCSSSRPWACAVCTFINQAANTECEVCLAERGAQFVAADAMAVGKKSKAMSQIRATKAPAVLAMRPKDQYASSSSSSSSPSSSSPSSSSPSSSTKNNTVATKKKVRKTNLSDGSRSSGAIRLPGHSSQQQQQQQRRSRRRSRVARDNHDTISSVSVENAAKSFGVAEAIDAAPAPSPPNDPSSLQGGTRVSKEGSRAAKTFKRRTEWPPPTSADALLVRKWFGEQLGNV